MNSCATCRLNSMLWERCLAMAFILRKPSSPCQITKLNLSGPRGALQPDWLVTVLTSEFVWGVIVGLVLAAFGAWLQAIFIARQQQKAQKDLIKNFCIDTVNNLKAIVEDMVNHRQRTQAIHSDYLALLDIEIGVFGRNREHIIHLPNPVRENVRKFVTDCAIRRAEIGNHLSQFTNLCTLADQLQSQ